MREIKHLGETNLDAVDLPAAMLGVVHRHHADVAARVAAQVGIEITIATERADPDAPGTI